MIERSRHEPEVTKWDSDEMIAEKLQRTAESKLKG